MKHIFLLLTTLLFATHTYAQQAPPHPAVEIRAVWLTTNWKLDWPKTGKTVAEQKLEVEKILDELQKNKFNVVLFQARAQGKAFYKSAIEESSPYYNNSSDFDPLAFAIEACHAREMECHAWITTFPVEKTKTSKKGTLLEKKPSYYKQVNGHWFLDPGRPETKDRLVMIAKEIVTKYDVDGIHLDYIRYPDNPKKFLDNDTYQKYGNRKNKDLWRKENVNRVVFEIYDAVKQIKNWVQVSSSPLGKYRALNGRDGWTAYESVHQDAGYWMEMGKHDMLFPMMYATDNNFYPYVDQWVEASNGRPIVPGLGAYQLEESEKNWQIKEIADQMNYTRTKDAKGQAYFRAGQIMNNKKGLKNTIAQLYKYPAKLPPLTWLEDRTPPQPPRFDVFKDEDGFLVFQWDAPSRNDRYTYNIYFSSNKHLNKDDASGLLVTNLYGNSYAFPASVGEFGFYYFVTASDRYHNESESAESVYFVHSEDIY